jgi:hypothetical protein
MPTAADIVLNDSAPAAHTFEPQSITPDKAVHVDRDSTTSAGQKNLILGVSPARPSRPTNRVTVRLNMPVEYTVDGVVRVRDIARHSSDTVLPEAMTTTEREDFAAFIMNAYANAVVKGLVEELEPVY